MPDNPQHWFTLTSRYGKDIDNPTQEDLQRALDELQSDNHEGMTVADYAEHCTAWLRFETDAGPHYLLSVNREGFLSFSEFISQESDDPVVELTQKVPPEKALALLMMLAEGKSEKVEEELAPNE